MSRALIRQLKNLKHTQVMPDETWLRKNRECLLTQINNTIPHSQGFGARERVWNAVSLLLPRALVYNIVRPVATLILIISLGIGGWVAAVEASYDSVPGDWLYPAKRVTEKTHVTVASVVGGRAAETKLRTEFAKRRAIETKKIVSTKDPAKMKKVSHTVQELKKEMQTIQNRLEEIKDSSNASVAAKDVNQEAQEIKEVLKEVKTDLLIRSTSTQNADVSSLSDQVVEAKNLVKDTAVKAVEVLVTKHLQGDTSLSKEEVKEIITNQLQTTVKETVEVRQNAEEVKKVVEVMNSEVKEIVKEAPNAEVASTTKALSQRIEQAARQTQEAAAKTQAIASSTDKTISEAQKLLSEDNLAMALDKVREATETVVAAEKIADTTMKAVQTVLPVVAVVSEVPVSSTIGVVVTTTTLSSSTTVVKVITVSTSIKTVVSTTSISTTTTVSGTPR